MAFNFETIRGKRLRERTRLPWSGSLAERIMIPGCRSSTFEGHLRKQHGQELTISSGQLVSKAGSTTLIDVTSRP